jgi:pilus assembly protein CpaE
LVPGETLRLLLVSAYEETRDTVGEALAKRAGDHRLYWVSQADLAASRAEDVLPHVVLVDDEPGGANPVTLIGQLAGRLPRAAILAMVDGGDLDTARRAMLAGARAFVTKPLNSDELLGALQQVLVQKSPRRSSRRCRSRMAASSPSAPRRAAPAGPSWPPTPPSRCGRGRANRWR